MPGTTIEDVTEMARIIQLQLPMLQRPRELARITQDNFLELETDKVSMAFLSPHTKYLPIEVGTDGETVKIVTLKLT